MLSVEELTSFIIIPWSQTINFPLQFFYACIIVYNCSRQGDFTIIPVLVGSLTADKEQRYGRIFAKYLADPENLFVISSDFCHWGKWSLDPYFIIMLSNYKVHFKVK